MKLYDAEYKFMSLIWDLAPVNSTELSRVCLEQLGWKKPTTYNMIRKLTGRGLIKNEKATVTALVPREDVQKFESETLLKKSFEGSLPVFLATFFDDKTLSREEADELKKIIEEAVK